MQLSMTGSDRKLDVSDAIFGEPFREGLVHQVVVSYRNAGRAGTKAQKTRSEVKGSTRKIKKQKGGGARHGAITAPIFVGGGRTFAAKPRSFEQKINRKMYRGAIRSILSELNRLGRLKIIESLSVDAASTKDLRGKLKDLDAEGALLITESADDNLYLSARNLPYVEVRDVQALDPVALISASAVVMTVDSLDKIQEWLK